jgi:hypothetical protein
MCIVKDESATAILQRKATILGNRYHRNTRHSTAQSTGKAKLTASTETWIISGVRFNLALYP